MENKQKNKQKNKTEGLHWNSDIAANIRKLREEKGIKQEELADALFVDTAVISNLERGKREIKIKDIEQIANHLKIDITYLFTYPKQFVDIATVSEKQDDDKVSITFEVNRKKRDYLLHLVMDDNVQISEKSDI